MESITNVKQAYTGAEPRIKVEFVKVYFGVVHSHKSVQNDRIKQKLSTRAEPSLVGGGGNKGLLYYGPID